MERLWLGVSKSIHNKNIVAGGKQEHTSQKRSWLGVIKSILHKNIVAGGKQKHTPRIDCGWG